MGSFDWSYTFSLLDYAAFWKAVGIVVALAALSWITAVVLGMGIALARQSNRGYLRSPVKVYVWFFRSMPLLVLIIFVYNIPQILPISRPLLNNPFWAGFIAMVLSETAYISEIHRGGLSSVGVGQREAARALGIRYGQMMRTIVIPQALRIALPGLGNQFAYIVKLTSLVSVISLGEILLTGEQLYTQNFKVLETLVAVSFYYVLLVSLFDILQRRIERRLDVASKQTELAQKESVTDDTPTLRTRRKKHPHAGEVIVKARDIKKSYGKMEVLRGIDLDVHKGEVVALVGPSGSGKTTVLRTLNHLETFDSGDVTFGDQPIGYKKTSDGRIRELSDAAVARQRRHVGMVFQNFNLFPHLTVLENLTLAPRLAGLGKQPGVLKTKASALLRKVGMDQHINRYPHQLSGGQQQRVAIARALAMEPKVMLFDEPTSALDPEAIGGVLQVMSDLAADGMTMVIATHEMSFVERVADWMVFIDAGKVVEQGVPETLFNNPQKQRTRNFFSNHASQRQLAATL